MKWKKIRKILVLMAATATCLFGANGVTAYANVDENAVAEAEKQAQHAEVEIGNIRRGGRHKKSGGQRGQRRQAQKRPPGSLCKNAKKAVNKKSARKHKCRAKPGHPVGKTKDAALLPLRFACGHCARAVSRRKRAKRGSCCDEDTKTIRVHLKKTPSFRPPPERGP